MPAMAHAPGTAVAGMPHRAFSLTCRPKVPNVDKDILHVNRNAAPAVIDMRTQAHSQRAGTRGTQRADSAAERVTADLEEALRSLTQDQMLVNQGLVEKILSCEQAESALRATEQRLHELLAHQHARREAERKRIARDIHDSLGQNLLVLRMDIVTLQQATADRHHRLHERLGAALDNVDVTLRTVKQLLGELRPAGLELGLLATLDLEVRKFTRNSRIACRLDADEGVDALALDEEQVLAVCRALQESLNNVFRHSLASRVGVHLGLRNGRLQMAVADNGIGFDPAAPRKSSSYGLMALEELAATLGGALEVASARGQGTRVVLVLPCGKLTTGHQ